MAQSDYKAFNFWKTIRVRNVLVNEIYNSKQIESVMDYAHKDGDIILCSYPKTGSTLMHYTLWMILHINEPLPNLNDMWINVAPFLNLVDVEQLNALPSPRFYKSHFSYDMMKINTKAKYIYIYRNPRDVIVSYYFYTGLFRGQHESLNMFFDKFLKGQIAYGCFFDNVMSFYRHKNESHVFLISYEEFLHDKKSHILKIARFLGEEYYQKLVDNTDNLEAIIRMTDFNYMKDNIDTAIKGEKYNVQNVKCLNMFRKGIIGDGKSVLTPDQMEKLKLKIDEKMGETTIINNWLPL